MVYEWRPCGDFVETINLLLKLHRIYILHNKKYIYPKTPYNKIKIDPSRTKDLFFYYIRRKEIRAFHYRGNIFNTIREKEDISLKIGLTKKEDLTDTKKIGLIYRGS